MRTAATALLAASGALLIGWGRGLDAQAVRIAAWGSYEAVTGSDDWSSVGTQVTWTSRPGHALWAGVELVSRFAERDGAERLGGLLHPGARWWASLEVATAVGPELVPKNAWEADVTRLVARRAGVGLTYQRRNYVVGAVDLLVPHATFPTGAAVWDVRVFVARNPSDRTDGAVLVRASAPIAHRVTGVAGAAAGRESYLVGAPPTQAVRSLRTVTALVGARIALGTATTIRVDGTAIHSEPVLSRRGLSVGIDRSF